jgi:hypothetical protein
LAGRSRLAKCAQVTIRSDHVLDWHFRVALIERRVMARLRRTACREAVPGAVPALNSQRLPGVAAPITDHRVARMHGYEPGQVEPTTELVLSHKHPDDLAKVKGLLKQSAAPFSSRHRIRTVKGDIRRVVVVGDAVTDADGQVIGTRGFYIDVTDSEIQQTVSDEISAIVAQREVIERAKGMLMLIYELDVDAAFEVLKWRSQELNIKLHRVAAKLIAELPALLTLPEETRRPLDHYLMTLDEADGA